MVTTRTNLTTRRTKGRYGSPVNLIGIHTMEAPEKSQTAENVAAYFQRVDASAHWCVDNNSRVRVVEDEDMAWTLPGANTRSLNLELAGYARQTADDWKDEYSIDMLENAALCAAEWVIKYGIAIRRLSDKEIRDKKSGFAGHVDVNRVYKKSSHWDPGPAFPWSYFLARVKAKVAELQGRGSSTPPKPSYNNQGYTTQWIRNQQAKLRKLGYNIEVDGFRGKETIAAVKDFQKDNGLTTDGIPGPDTSAALDEAVAKNKKTTAEKVSTSDKQRPDCSGLQRAVRTNEDNVWGANTDRHFFALRAASSWGGNKFPYGVAFAQKVVGTRKDGKWGEASRKAHDNTVENVQKHLKKLGYDPGEIDGRWGDNTEKAFQAARRDCRV